MLTGRAAFSGNYVTDILAAVIGSEPDWPSLPQNLHGRLREVLERCLKKELRDRYHDISDVRMDIQKVLTDPGGVLAHPAEKATHRTRLKAMLPWIATVVIISVIAGTIVWKLTAPEPDKVMRFDYQLTEDQQFAGLFPVAVSRDGKQFVFSTPKGLYLRSMDELIAKPIPGAEGSAVQPFFSPDGKWIGYWSRSDRKLKKIAINGGTPVALCDVQQLLGASWGAENKIVYGQYPGGIMRISGDGGAPESLVKAKSESPEYPQILPDGRSILYTSYGNPSHTAGTKIMVQSLKSAEPKELFAGYDARYLPTGHIAYMLPNSHTVFAIPFDLEKLQVTGGPVSVVEGVGDFAVCNTGTLVYTPPITSGAAGPICTIVWVDREGKEAPIAAAPNLYAYPKISPDGTRVALTYGITGSPNIWIWDLLRKNLTRLTFGEKGEIQSIWTPDGKRIVFCSGITGTGDICWKAADGTGEVEKLVSVPGRQLMPYSISRDGKYLVIIERLGTTVSIGIMSMEGNHALKPLLQQGAEPQISPNGRWMAYESSESGQMEVYVRPFPDIDKGKWQVSTSGGASPLWSPNCRELFYLSKENSVMATAAETEPAFRLGIPRVLFKSIYVAPGPFSGVPVGTPWDISPDGKRFLMLKEATSPGKPVETPRKINIVVNWFEELKQRVPMK